MDKRKSLEIYSVFVVLTALLGCAKIGGVPIPLWMVIAPLWLPIAYVILSILFMGVFYAIYKKIKK